MALEAPCYSQTKQGMTCASLERERASTGLGLQQPQESRGKIKAKAAAFSQHRGGRTARQKRSIRPDPLGQATHTNRSVGHSLQECGTRTNLPALGPRLKGSTGHLLEAAKRSLPGEKSPVCARSSPHTQGERDNTVSVSGLYYGPR